jgi:TetR/AcrR family transcriptional regulator, transcriptional repressor for nem operon
MSRPPNLELRGKILCSAHKLIYRHGFKGVSMDEVAREAGMKKANLFHYYPTKEALGLAVFDYALGQLQSKIQSSLSMPGADPIQSVETMFDQASGGMKESGCSGGCFVGNMAQELSDYNETLRCRVAEHMQRWREQWAKFLDGYRERGYFRSDFNAQQAASGLLSLFEGAMIFCKANKTVEALQDARSMAVRHFQSFRSS